MNREEITRDQRLKIAIQDLDYAASPTRSFIVCDRDAAELRDDLTALLAENERLRGAITEACDLLAERTYGNRARSPGHNARLRLEVALNKDPDQ